MRALDSEVKRAGLTQRDAGLATEIVYGTLRVLPELDARIAPHVRRGLAETDGLTLAVLRAAAYQLWHLGRLPTHAIVHEAVGFIRTTRGRQNGGFVNAVLRRLAEQRPAEPTPADRVVLPEWLRRALVQSLGAERAAAFEAPRGEAPPLCLAVAAQAREGLLEELTTALDSASADGEIAPGTLSPMAITVRRLGDLRRLAAYREGRFWVQEEGAQLVALAVNPQPGERIADLCAGHGGKTLCLASLLGGRGELTAVDIDESKLDNLEREFERLGLPVEMLQCDAIDLSVGTGGLEPLYDRVLLDAPCTGVGTVLRRPELLLRLEEADPARLAALQLAIARNATQLVRNGGHLLVAVCSPLAEEGAALAAQMETQLPELRRVPAEIPGLDFPPDQDQILRIGPWMSKGASAPDGYQVIHFLVDRAGGCAS